MAVPAKKKNEVSPRKKEAMEIADDWNGGEQTFMYKFFQTGECDREKVLEEIEVARKKAVEHAVRYKIKMGADTRRLELLKLYVTKLEGNNK